MSAQLTAVFPVVLVYPLALCSITAVARDERTCGSYGEHEGRHLLGKVWFGNKRVVSLLSRRQSSILASLNFTSSKKYVSTSTTAPPSAFIEKEMREQCLSYITLWKICYFRRCLSRF